MSNRKDLGTFMSPDYVDLSVILAPKVIEELDCETIFQQLLVDFKARRTEYNALLESDPVIIALECAAYRETVSMKPQKLLYWRMQPARIWIILRPFMA
jgi:hypothetical protein